MKKIVLVLCCLILPAACGKRGNLDYPPNAVLRQYPAPRDPAAANKAKHADPSAETLLGVQENLISE